MAEFVSVANVADIASGSGKTVEVNGKALLFLTLMAHSMQSMVLASTVADLLAKANCKGRL